MQETNEENKTVEETTKEDPMQNATESEKSIQKPIDNANEDLPEETANTT
jgi:hypothetical protein